MPTKADLEIQIDSLKEQIKRLQESEDKLEKDIVMLRKELYRAKNVPQTARNNTILKEENKKLIELLKISNIIYDKQSS